LESTLHNADWAAAAVFVVFILGFAETARRGWQAPDALYEHYRTNRAQTKALIDTDHILPELAFLVAEVNAEVSASVGATDPLTDVQTLVDNLQWAGYRSRLDRLSHLYGDFGLLDGLFDSAVWWARCKAVCSGASGVALAVVALPIVFSNISVPAIPLGGATGLLIIAVVGLAIASVLEIGQRNRLGRLFRKYE
jgi:hypothetical protein